MDENKLSRWIAEKLEPLTTLGILADVNEYVRVWGGSKGTTCWRTIRRYVGFEWHPRDMVNDPAMTVMLLKAMIMEYGWPDTAQKISETRTAIDDGTSDAFQLAVAEAFAVAHGFNSD